MYPIFTLFFVLLTSLNLLAATTADHNKQVVGYITQWDPWKDTKAGFVAKGAANHLNVDMSKYTILNYSFFGVAVDGSLHSGDFRNKNIYKPSTVQQPGELLNGDIYSSWDYYLISGEMKSSLVTISLPLQPLRDLFQAVVDGPIPLPVYPVLCPYQ